jgi:hypothetical protein
MMRSLIIAGGVLVLCACAKKPEPQELPVSEVASAPAPLVTDVAAAAPEVVIDVESLPVQEQFEQEAEREVDSKNLVAKLDELEKEIGSE